MAVCPQGPNHMIGMSPSVQLGAREHPHQDRKMMHTSHLQPACTVKTAAFQTSGSPLQTVGRARLSVAQSASRGHLMALRGRWGMPGICILFGDCTTNPSSPFEGLGSPFKGLGSPFHCTTGCACLRGHPPELQSNSPRIEVQVGQE